MAGLEETDGALPQGGPPAPAAEDIVAALRSAGWLLEQDTQSALLEENFFVYPGTAYPDPDDPTVSREIDVMAYRQLLRDDAMKVSVGIRIIAECKQSTMPYVVVGRGPYPVDRQPLRVEHSLRFPSVEVGAIELSEGRKQLRTVAGLRYLGLWQTDGAPWTDRFVGTQLTRLDRRNGKWSASNEGIYGSLVYPLAKAVTHYRKEDLKHVGGRVDHDPNRGDWASIEFRFPVIVTSAPVYELNVETTPLEPHLVPWTNVTRDIQSKSVEGVFHIDVTSFDDFPTYLRERVGAFARAVQAVPIERFVTRIDHGWEPSGPTPGGES